MISVTPAVCPYLFYNYLLELILNIFTFWSEDPKTIYYPFGENFTQLIYPIFPSILFTIFPVYKFQIFSVLSYEQLTIYFSFGEKLIPLTWPECPFKHFENSKFLSNIITKLSTKDAINEPDGENIYKFPNSYGFFNYLIVSLSKDRSVSTRLRFLRIGDLFAKPTSLTFLSFFRKI